MLGSTLKWENMEEQKMGLFDKFKKNKESRNNEENGNGSFLENYLTAK